MAATESPSRAAWLILWVLGSCGPDYVINRPTLHRALIAFGLWSEEGVRVGLRHCIASRWLEEIEADAWKATGAGIVEIRRVTDAQEALRAAEQAKGPIWFEGFGLTLRSRYGTLLGWLTFSLLMIATFSGAVRSLTGLIRLVAG